MSSRSDRAASSSTLSDGPQPAPSRQADLPAFKSASSASVQPADQWTSALHAKPLSAENSSRSQGLRQGSGSLREDLTRGHTLPTDFPPPAVMSATGRRSSDCDSRTLTVASAPRASIIKGHDHAPPEHSQAEMPPQFSGAQVTEPAATGPSCSVSVEVPAFSVGQKVVCGGDSHAEVVAVDTAQQQPAYVVRLADGSERTTEAAQLAPRRPSAAVGGLATLPRAVCLSAVSLKVEKPENVRRRSDAGSAVISSPPAPLMSRSEGTLLSQSNPTPHGVQRTSFVSPPSAPLSAPVPSGGAPESAAGSAQPSCGKSARRASIQPPPPPGPQSSSSWRRDTPRGQASSGLQENWRHSDDLAQPPPQPETKSAAMLGSAGCISWAPDIEWEESFLQHAPPALEPQPLYMAGLLADGESRVSGRDRDALGESLAELTACVRMLDRWPINAGVEDNTPQEVEEPEEVSEAHTNDPPQPTETEQPLPVHPRRRRREALGYPRRRPPTIHDCRKPRAVGATKRFDPTAKASGLGAVESLRTTESDLAFADRFGVLPLPLAKRGGYEPTSAAVLRNRAPPPGEARVTVARTLHHSREQLGAAQLSPGATSSEGTRWQLNTLKGLCSPPLLRSGSALRKHLSSPPAEPTNSSTGNEAVLYSKGTIVRHPSHGDGEVVAVTTDDDGQRRVHVSFDTVGTHGYLFHSLHKLQIVRSPSLRKQPEKAESSMRVSSPA
eukprot:TRINITY_DN19305_c0_g1_i2.p1 TRINITY_DN19305_c0_g1~~TRINITY_DN19305_c0_g1_i2.p1  ORF type:complete len:750 (+),score=228.12 TRINITY_DN19305_c0_g1_i2:78-2252(+)